MRFVAITCFFQTINVRYLPFFGKGGVAQSGHCLLFYHFFHEGFPLPNSCIFWLSMSLTLTNHLAHPIPQNSFKEKTHFWCNFFMFLLIKFPKFSTCLFASLWGTFSHCPAKNNKALHIFVIKFKLKAETTQQQKTKQLESPLKL